MCVGNGGQVVRVNGPSLHEWLTKNIKLVATWCVLIGLRLMSDQLRTLTGGHMVCINGPSLHKWPTKNFYGNFHVQCF